MGAHLMAVSGLLGDFLREERPEAGGFTGRLQRIRPSTDNIDPNAIVLPPDIGTMRQIEGDSSPQWNEDMLRVLQLMRRMGAI